MRNGMAAAMLVVAALAAAAPAQKARRTPYWASISAGEAMMRTGPGKNYPAIWLYRRADLPIKVLEVYPSWRKVEDPGGTRGWMLVNLLSDARTALVMGSAPRAMHEQPSDASKILFRARPGVVGRISDCVGAWCKLDVRGRAGYIRAEHIWGLNPGETVE